jgi:hypothetical protein
MAQDAQANAEAFPALTDEWFLDGDSLARRAGRLRARLSSSSPAGFACSPIGDVPANGSKGVAATVGEGSVCSYACEVEIEPTPVASRAYPPRLPGELRCGSDPETR